MCARDNKGTFWKGYVLFGRARWHGCNFYATEGKSVGGQNIDENVKHKARQTRAREGFGLCIGNTAPNQEACGKIRSMVYVKIRSMGGIPPSLLLLRLNDPGRRKHGSAEKRQCSQLT